MKISPLKYLMILVTALIALMLIVGIFVYFVTQDSLPSLEQLENPKQNHATQIFSADGEILDHFFIERRVSLPIDSIPKDFINALVAVEDRTFYDHWGVHTVRIFKAAVKNVLAMRTKEGASTLTMQLAKNLYFTPENSFKRKIREAVTAMQIERTYTKDEIIAMYANTVAFGRGAYGIQIAAQVYFDKSPLELTTAECAFLVGLLKAPEHYNGIVNYEKAITRRNLVLSLMMDQGYISESQYVKAAEEPLNLARVKDKSAGRSGIAPHFIEMIRQRLSKSNNLSGADLYRDGLIIYTTLNSTIQRYANEAVQEHLNEYQKIFNRTWSWSRNRTVLEDLITKAIRNCPEYIAAPESRKPTVAEHLRSSRAFIDSVKNAATTLQVAVVVMDPTNGAILAMVGASPKFMQEHPDAKYSLNHAVQIRRQPGSSFKPFTYTSALMAGMTPQSMIECGPYTWTNKETGEVWSPRGTGHCGPGEQISLSQALAASINSVAARLITQVTNPQAVVELANRMGIQSKLRAVPALALGGGGEVTPLELTNAYATFANQGIHVLPMSINRIEDQFGNIIQEESKTVEASDILSKRITSQMTYMLQGVVDYGTGYKIREVFKNIQAAGKTGTTNDNADAWFVGYTPQLVAGIWVGFDDQRISFSGGYGYASLAAAPIWGILMNKIYSDDRLPYKQKVFTFVLDSLDSAIRQQYFDQKPDIQNLMRDDQDLNNNVPPSPPPLRKDSSKPKATFPKLPKADGDKKKAQQLPHF